MKYTVESHQKTYQYQEFSLADQLVDHLVEDWLKDALAHPFREQRLAAIEKLAQYGRTRFELGVLTRMSEHDPDLEVRSIATEAVHRIQERMY